MKTFVRKKRRIFLKMRVKTKVGFWNGERCEYCERPIVEKIVDLPRRVGKRYVLIKKCSGRRVQRMWNPLFYSKCPQNHSIDHSERTKSKKRNLYTCVFALRQTPRVPL
jgi:hypothetical protein